MQLGSRASQHSFSQVLSVHIQRSAFDRSYPVKTTCYFDELTPFFVEEILPGDTINLGVHSFGRLSTQIRPTMDVMKVDWYFFFVPNRLVWNNWEKFMGQQNNPGDSTDYLIPVLDTSTQGIGVGSRADQYGIPPLVGTGGEGPYPAINALPFRAYNLIWNEWFRDQNLQQSEVVDLDDGPDDYSNYSLNFKKNKPHDYFTSAFLTPQKGPAVTIPLSATAPVVRSANAPGWLGFNAGTQTAGANGNLRLNAGGQVDNTLAAISLDPNGGLVANTAALGGTIEQLRQAMMMQSLLELNQRGGTRYIEVILAHFRVVSPDFRLQRPEYLGGGQTQINSNPVTATSASDDNPQANLAAFGTTSSHGSKVGFSHSFVEHGYVIGMMCPRGAVSYQQGMNRMWSRRTKYDFFWPKLQELGEQAILRKEIMVTNVPADGELVWGYQERYAEYRYHPAEIRGKFRSVDPQSLDVWHLAEEFAQGSPAPALSSTFIQLNTPIERTLVATTEPPIIMDMYFQFTHTRPMTTYGVPASLGRF